MGTNSHALLLFRSESMERKGVKMSLSSNLRQNPRTADSFTHSKQVIGDANAHPSPTLFAPSSPHSHRFQGSSPLRAARLPHRRCPLAPLTPLTPLTLTPLTLYGCIPAPHKPFRCTSCHTGIPKLATTLFPVSLYEQRRPHPKRQTSREAAAAPQVPRSPYSSRFAGESP
jgi:hypothetical protein